MNAKELYTYLSAKYTNHYFGSYEELNYILDNSVMPCVVVIPVKKTVRFISDRFRIVETVVIASLDKMELDFETSAVYDSIKTLEYALLKNLYPHSNSIENIEVLSELNKFDANVLFAAFAIDIVNTPVCNE